MENKTKKCPMCAEIIPLAASVCEFCGTRFEVSTSGYCPKCHQVREADANGCCKICNDEIIDARVESRIVEEPAQDNLALVAPERPLPARPAPPKAWLWGLGAVLVLGAAALAWSLSLRQLPGPLPATSTDTSTPAPTPPETTALMPSWAAEFAGPILSIIQDRSPSLEDDFGTGSTGWLNEDCKGSMKYVDEQFVLADCRIFRFDNNWPDFVLEVDVRVRSGSWTLHFRDSGDNGHALRINNNGNVLIGFGTEAGNINYMGFDQAALSNNQVNHVLLIARGNSFAFYLNGQPFYFAENDLYGSGRCSYDAEGGSTVMDNFRIWNITDISAP